MNIYKTTLLFIVLLLLVTLELFAQPGPGRRGLNRGWWLNSEQLNLSAEQLKKIEDIRLSFQQEMIDMQADIKKEELNLQKLKKNNPNRNDYLNGVKKLGSLKQEAALKRANHHMDIYELLTAEQKEIFDNMPRGKRSHRNFRGGYGWGSGFGLLN
jgi:Spy/CpxP family protein refolding chaperone